MVPRGVNALRGHRRQRDDERHLRRPKRNTTQGAPHTRGRVHTHTQTSKKFLCFWRYLTCRGFLKHLGGGRGIPVGSKKVLEKSYWLDPTPRGWDAGRVRPSGSWTQIAPKTWRKKLNSVEMTFYSQKSKVKSPIPIFFSKKYLAIRANNSSNYLSCAGLFQT